MSNEDVWRAMSSFPKDGSHCDILFEGGTIAKNIHWGLPPIGSVMTYVGSVNVLSPWLMEEKPMLGWRLHVKQDLWDGK